MKGGSHGTSYSLISSLERTGTKSLLDSRYSAHYQKCVHFLGGIYLYSTTVFFLMSYAVANQISIVTSLTTVIQQFCDGA